METENGYPSMILREIASRLQKDSWDFIVAGGSALAKYKNKVWKDSDYDIFIPHYHPSNSTNLKQTLENDMHYVKDVERYLEEKLNVIYYQGDGTHFIIPSSTKIINVRRIGLSKGSIIPDGRVITRLIFEDAKGRKFIVIDFILSYVQNFYTRNELRKDIQQSKTRNELLTNSFVEILDRFDLDVCRVGFVPMINVAQNKKRAIDCMTAILIRLNIYKDIRRLLCEQIYKQSTKDWELVYEWKFGKTFNKHAALNPNDHYSVMNNFHPRPEEKVFSRYNKYTQRGFKIVMYPCCFPLLITARDELDRIKAKKKVKKERKAEKKRQDANLTKNEVSRLKMKRLI